MPAPQPTPEVAIDDPKLLAVERLDGAPEQRRKPSPVAGLPMRDVLRLVVRLDMLERRPRGLVHEAAVAAADEREAAGAAGEIVLGRQELRGRPAAAVVAGDGLERGCGHHDVTPAT